ncbi:MAG: TolC family protein [Pseudomonadota bacterium]
MWFRILSGPALAGLLLCLSAPAQAARPLTLADAVQLVEQNNPQLAARRAERDAADTRIDTARLKPNPELKITVEDALGTGDYRAFDAAQFTVALVQVLEPAARRDAKVQAAEAAVQIEAVGIEAQRWELLAETHRRYALALIRAGRLSLAEEASANAQRLLAATERRVSAAAAPVAELERARVAAARADLEQEDYEHELASARVSLAALWQGQDDFGPLAGDAFKLPLMRPLADWQAALASSPRLRRFTAERALLKAERAATSAERQRSWQVDAGLRHYREQGDIGFVAGLSLPLRLRDPQAPRLAEADARLRAAEAGEAAAMAEARAEIFGLYQELNHGRLHLTRLDEVIVPAAKRALDATEYAVQRGRYGAWEWLAARTEWLAARKEMLDDAELLHTTLAELERVSGLALFDSPLNETGSKGVAP